MTIIVVGCPYTQMRGLSQSIANHSSGIDIINFNDITAVSFEELSVRQFDDPIHISDVSCSFIRYPYDLIPPHSGTFKLREKTEFLKTVSLMLQDCAINPIMTAWKVRNRLFSLAVAHKVGLKVPISRVVTTPAAQQLSGEYFFIKAMGNCFVTYKESEIETDIKPFLRLEEDGGEFAWILPAQKYNTSDFSRYIDNVEAGFVQEEIANIREYRIYIIKSKVLAYCREDIDNSDKSAANYTTTTLVPSDRFLRSLKEYAQLIGLEYLCVDVIQNKDEYYVVDVNPYGSLPAYDLLPEPTDALAKYMIEKASMSNDRKTRVKS